MPVYDYLCDECGEILDQIRGYDDQFIDCPKGCGNKAKRLITGTHRENDDAGWIKSVLDVVDKDSRAPHVVEFRKNPTRANMKAYMRGEGLRHFEPGEEKRRPDPVNMDRINKECIQKHMRRNAIDVR